MAECILLRGGGADLDVVTAGRPDILAGKVIVDKDGEPLTGTMPNRGAVNPALNAGESYSIPDGYHNGGGKVTANSLASQTVSNATAAQILTGFNAYVNGSRVQGTIPLQSGQTITPGASQQTISCSGKYMTGNIVINGVRTYASVSRTVTSSTNKRVFYGLNSGVDPNLSAYYVTITNIGFTPLFVSLVGEYGPGNPLHVACDSWGLNYSLRTGGGSFGSNMYWLKNENISSSTIILPAGDYSGGRNFHFQAFGYY